MGAADRTRPYRDDATHPTMPGPVIHMRPVRFEPAPGMLYGRVPAVRVPRPEGEWAPARASPPQ